MLRLVAALVLAAVATSTAASAPADGATPRRPPAREKTRGYVVAAVSTRAYATRRLAALLKRRTRPRRPQPPPPPQPPPQPQPQPPPPQPPAPPPAATAGGFGVAFDNPEYLDAAAQRRELDSMAQMGARWVRFDIKWSDVQWDGPASFDYSKYEPLVDAARARGLKVLANLAYSPAWARPAGTTDKWGPDTDARRTGYATFVERTVRHFAGRVSHWELWNEPNVDMFWNPRPSAAHYAALIRAAYPRIKAADPSAVVVAGATAPADSDGTRIDEVGFIQAVYASGGGGHFDAWSHHPYTVDPSWFHPNNAWTQMAGTSPSIRSVMGANGDGSKQLWGTEFGGPTHGVPHTMTEAAHAAQITDAYTTWNAYSWAGPLFVYSQRDMRVYGASGDSWFYYGMLRHDFTPKPAWDAYRAVAT